MAGNQQNKGKDVKGSNYDELSNVGTPKQSNTGSQQSASQDKSWPGKGSQQNAGKPSGPGESSQRGQDVNRQSGSRTGSRQGGMQDQSDLASGPGDNSQRGYGGSQQSDNLQSGGRQGNRHDTRTPGGNQLSDDDLGADDIEQR